MDISMKLSKVLKVRQLFSIPGALVMFASHASPNPPSPTSQHESYESSHLADPRPHSSIEPELVVDAVGYPHSGSLEEEFTINGRVTKKKPYGGLLKKESVTNVLDQDF